MWSAIHQVLFVYAFVFLLNVYDKCLFCELCTVVLAL
jgi:hypothetical protein